MTSINSSNISSIESSINRSGDNNNSELSVERYIFWLDDVTVLYKNNGYTKFVPTSEMTRIEQLNALTRLFIYLTVVFFICDRTNEWMYIPIIGIIMCIVLYNVFEVDDKGKREELLRMKRKISKPLSSYALPDVNYRTYQVNDNGEIVTIDIDKLEAEQYRENYENAGNADSLDSVSDASLISSLDSFSSDVSDASSPRGSTDYDIEVGYYDSDGKLQYGKYKNPLTPSNQNEVSYTLDEMRLYERNKCRQPTEGNPFMNPSVDDFNKENIPVACNADDEDINKEMTLKFNGDIYRDIQDVFDKKNSQRQFYTVAHNIPNDQEAFARWCYKFPDTCKVDQERCLKYQDLRAKY